jgi:myo-inositol-1(or 4)-monophosphatase
VSEPIAARLALAEEVARKAGDMLLAFRRDRLDVVTLGAQDYVTEAVYAVETLVREAVARAFPGDEVLGEEGGDVDARRREGGGAGAQRLWVVDPIDGTINFIRGMPSYAVSIAYVEAGEVEAGVVHVPMLGETFVAQRGAGARCNGRAIRVSECSRLSAGRIAAGYAQRGSKAQHLRFVGKLLRAGSDILKFNSAAVCLAMVAAGRIDGYYERELRSWDVLAGQLLVREAGGWTNTFGAQRGLLALDYTIACGMPLVAELRAAAGV